MFYCTYSTAHRTVEHMCSEPRACMSRTLNLFSIQNWHSPRRYSYRRLQTKTEYTEVTAKTWFSFCSTGQF